MTVVILFIGKCISCKEKMHSDSFLDLRVLFRAFSWILLNLSFVRLAQKVFWNHLFSSSNIQHFCPIHSKYVQ